MLAAFLPMLMIPVLAGGVTGGEALREGLVLLNTFWFSLCAGLWASARSAEGFKAIKKACLLVGFITLAPLIWNYLYNPSQMPSAALHIFDFASPLVTLIVARGFYYKGSEWMFWISLAAVQLLGWLLLLFAGIHLRHSLRESDKIATNRAPKNRTAENLFDEAASPDTVSRPAKKRNRFFDADGNPVAWLVQNQRGILTTLWIAAAIEVLYFASSWAVFRGMFTLGWPSVIGWVVWFAASASTDALFARAGSKFFYDSKRSGQLETLLTTPLGPRGVADGHWSALKKLLAWPVAVGLGSMLLDEDISLITEIGQPGGYSPGWVT